MTSPPLSGNPREDVIPPLKQSDRLTRDEFERRFDAMPNLKEAELIEGVVHISGPVPLRSHAKPRAHLIGWLGIYGAFTPGVEGGAHGHIRLDMDNEPQPAALLLIDPACGGHAHHHTAGTGPLYQGRFKAFPVQEDEHLLTAWRYVERNALRAKLVKRAEDWRWSSGYLRQQQKAAWLSAGPVPLPAEWQEYVNAPQTAAELAALRRSVARGAPFGEASWQQSTAERLGLESSLRPRGRPKGKA